MGRRTIWILVASAGTVVLACVGVGIWGLMVFLSGGRAGPLIAELKSRGEPVTTAEIAPPKVPDRENAAPIYAKAFAVLPKGNGGRDIDNLLEFVRGGYRRDDPKDWKLARTVVARYARALDIAQEAAERPKCRYPVDWKAGWQANLSHLDSLRTLVVLAAASAIVKAEDGDARAAVRSIAIGFRAAESVRDEPILAPFLNRVGSMKRLSRGVAGLVDRVRISEEQARVVEREIGRIGIKGDFARALKGERAIVITEFERLPDIVAQGWEPGKAGSASKNGRAMPFPAKTALKAFVSRDEVYYIRAMNDRIANADQPYYLRARAAAARGADDSPRYSIVSRNLVRTADNAFCARDEAITAVAGCRIMLKLAVFRNRFGSYPATLPELRKKLGWNPPADPFSGRDFVLTRQGKWLLLYSIGPNLKDDGGTGPDPAKRRSYVASGDIIWRLTY